MFDKNWGTEELYDRIFISQTARFQSFHIRNDTDNIL